MARREITYSQVIAGLKIGLPLIALVALSTMFLFSESASPTSAIPFAKIDLEARAKDQQVTSPYFAGQTITGYDVEITSEFAKPDQDDPRVTYAENLQAQIKIAEGNTVRIQSNTAQMNSLSLQALLSGDLIIRSTNGYDLQTQDIALDINKGTALAQNPVTGTGPAGTFTAGAMELQAGTDDQAARFLFTNGVNLLYKPQ